jgi:hypothetical protein
MNFRSEVGGEAQYIGPGSAYRPRPLIHKVVNRKDLQKRDYIANPSPEKGV